MINMVKVDGNQYLLSLDQKPLFQNAGCHSQLNEHSVDKYLYIIPNNSLVIKAWTAIRIESIQIEEGSSHLKISLVTGGGQGQREVSGKP